MISASRFLPLSLFALAKLAFGDTVSYQDPAYETGAYAAAPFQNFTSSSLHPPWINFLTTPTSVVDSNYTLLSIRGTDVKQAMNVIMDNNGSLVWSGAEYGASMDLIVQTYQGEDYLTFFNGSFSGAGYGTGQWMMLNSSYDLVKTVNMINQTDKTCDFHEFLITEDDTALVESWPIAIADLSSFGGPVDGYTFDCVFQEIDLATNTLLFQWNSLDHVSVDESYFSITDNAGNSSTNPFDHCHLNSLEKDTSGNYIVSMRGTSTVYSISATTGEVLWRLGGKNTNFTMGTGSSFWYQHDARLMSPSTSSPFNISLFDNANGGGTDVETTARGIILSVDTDAMTATLVAEYIPSFNHTAASQGSMQILENGNRFVGWGAEPFFTEYAADGTIVMDAQFGTDASTSTESYRAFKKAWTGHPRTTPSFAIVANGTTTAYTSWNGATEVAIWSLMGGTSPTTLSSVSNTTRSGFETVLPVSGTYAYLAAAALAADGTCLGVSDVHEVSSQTSTGIAGTCPSGAASTSSSSSSTIASAAASAESSTSSCSAINAVSHAGALSLAAAFAMRAALW